MDSIFSIGFLILSILLAVAGHIMINNEETIRGILLAELGYGIMAIIVISTYVSAPVVPDVAVESVNNAYEIVNSIDK